MAVHEGIKKFSCEFCQKAFAHREGMMKHIRTIHGGVRHNCEYCGKSFSQSSALKTHVKNSHPHFADTEVKRFMDIASVAHVNPPLGPQ